MMIKIFHPKNRSKYENFNLKDSSIDKSMNRDDIIM